MLNEDGSAGHHETSRSLDISFRSVREQINRELSCIGSCLTPYIALERARKVLAPYSIFIPATNYLEGDTGVRTFSVSQFHALTGQTNDGKVVTKTESPYNIYFDYDCSGGMFYCRCKILTDEELETYMDNYERAHIHEEKEKKDHPLVARVKHAQIIDAWQSHWKTKDRTVDHKTIIAKLKKKGLSVSHKEIDDSIEAHTKKKKKKLDERVQEYKDRLDELTAPTWRKDYRPLKESLDENHYEKKLDKKTLKAHHHKETVEEGLVQRAVRALKKHSGKQATDLHKKVNKQMDDKQTELLGRKTTGSSSDNETLRKSERYKSLNQRHIATGSYARIPTHYMRYKKED